MSNIIIIGASSGIGRELALQYGADARNKIGIAARRETELKTIAAQIPAQCEYQIIDLEQSERSRQMAALFSRFETIDLIIYCAGFGEINPKLDWDLCRKTLEVNVMGFTEIINASYHIFSIQRHGHLAVISSIGGLRGAEDDSGYSASKAYMLRYMEGISRKANKEKCNLICSTILPGFVDTQMAKGDKFFWMCGSPRKLDNWHKCKRLLN